MIHLSPIRTAVRVFSRTLPTFLLIAIAPSPWISAQQPHTDREWSLAGFIPKNDAFDKFVAAPSVSPTRPDFGKERIVSRISPDGAGFHQWDIHGATQLEYRARSDNPGIVETLDASDEFTVGVARIRLTGIELMSDNDTALDTLHFDALGNPKKNPESSRPIDSPKPRAITQILLKFSIQGGPATFDDCHWKDASDGAQGTTWEKKTVTGEKEVRIRIPTYRAHSNALQIGFTVCAGPWQTGVMRVGKGQDLKLGDLTLKCVGTQKFAPNPPVSSTALYRYGPEGGYGGGGGEGVMRGGVGRLIALSHRESRNRLSLIASEGTNAAYGKHSRLLRDDGIYVVYTETSKADTLRFKRLSASKRIVLKVPPLNIPKERIPPSDLLDMNYSDWGRLPAYPGGFKEETYCAFGIKIPRDYHFQSLGLGNSPRMPHPENPNATLREVLSLYFKEATDSGKIVRLNSKTGEFSIESSDSK